MSSGIQVLELESTNVKALYRRAQAYIELVDLELAELDVKKALEIDPDNRYDLCQLNFRQLLQCFSLARITRSLLQHGDVDSRMPSRSGM